LLEFIDNRPGHVPNGCGSVSRLLIFGTQVLGFIAVLLKLEYSERRTKERLEAARRELDERTEARTDKLRSDVRHDVRGELTPVKLAATAAVDKVIEIERATNGNLAEAVRVAAEQARAAEREQMLTDPRMMEAMRQVIRQVCQERDKHK
jgi:hypothetical protein